MTAATAFPLTWPPTFPRAKSREKGAFRATLAGAMNNVQDTLRLFAQDSGKKIESLVISSNVTLGQSNPADPGVAIWFVWDGLTVCIAVDRYARIEGNRQAIFHIIEARRVELRHGTLALVRATFQGFAALPAPEGSSWREVLGYKSGLRPDRAMLDNSYKSLRSAAHPDKGGDSAKFNAIEQAYKAAKQELGYV